VESKRTEEHRVAERFSLLDHMPVGVCVLRNDLTVLFWNNCLAFWTGIEARDIVGRAITAHIPSFGEAPYRSRLKAVFQGGPPAVFSSQLHKHLFPAPLTGGRERVQQTTAVAVPAETAETGDGPPDHYALCTVEDVTELTRRIQDYRTMHQTALAEAARNKLLEEEKARMEERARHMHKLESIGVLASGISHDFNNLLAIIVGNTDIIVAGAADRDLVLRCAAEIHKASERAASLVSQILSYSGGGMFHLSVVDISALVEDMRYLLTAPMGKHIDVRFALAADLPPVVGDESQLQQILINLVTNASEAIPEGRRGAITITTDVLEADGDYLETTYLREQLPAGTYVYLDVADNGTGLDTGLLDKVFDPFFTTKFAGRGLGLAAVLGIVRAHKGAIRVDSVPGEGATFRILLPVSLALKGEARPAPEHHAIAAHDGSRGVLLVDDEEMVLELAQHLLEERGYTVYPTANAAGAMEAFNKYRDAIDVVLLDVVLPDMAGHDLALAIRDIRRDIPIILFSGNHEAEARSHFTGLHVSAFLKKPFGASALLQTLEDVLARTP